MGRYLIRRLLFFILVLFIVSVFTFFIFVKLPSGDPAIRAAGRHATPSTIAATRHKFGLDQPLYVQYGRFAKGLDPLARAVPQQGGLLLLRQPRAGEGGDRRRASRSRSRSPSGAAILWLADRDPDRDRLRDQTRRRWRPGGDVVRPVRGVGAHVLAGPVLLYVFWFKLGWAPPSAGSRSANRSIQAVISRAVHPALVRLGADVRGLLLADGARQPDGDHERGLHPDGARQGHVREAGDLQARAARRAHPGRHDVRPRRRASCWAAPLSPRRSSSSRASACTR